MRGTRKNTTNAIMSPRVTRTANIRPIHALFSIYTIQTTGLYKTFWSTNPAIFIYPLGLPLAMISIILMEPERPGNLGAVARIMKNFGFSRLVLINPRCAPKDQEAIKRAKHGRDVLTNAIITDENYLHKFNLLIGTSAIAGTDYNILRCPVTPREAAEKIKGIRGNIGLLIGREGPGLTNEEIGRCDFIVSIPASKKYPTLNISHALAILLYEIFQAQLVAKSVQGIELARQIEKTHLMKLFHEVLDTASFPSDYRKQIIVKVWKQVIGKSMLTKREAYALMGFLRKITRK